MASLGKDISKIRKEKNLTIEQIQEETRIPLHILQTIEKGSLFEDIDENKTYIRSYVRSYAKALGIQNERIITCLNKAEAGLYNGELLNPPASQKDQTSDSSAEEGAEPTDSEKPSGPESKRESTISKHWSYDESARPEPSVHSLNWAKVGDDLTSLQTYSVINISLAVIALLIFGGLIYFFVFGGNPETPNMEAPSEPSGSVLSVDSLDNEFINVDTTTTATPADDATTEPSIALDDTLRLIVYAAYEKLEPVRINSDVTADTLPYWIERGHAMRFEFIDTIRVRGQFSRMELLFRGHVIQNFSEIFSEPASRFLTITRNDFTDEKWFMPTPDSLLMDAPPPDSVLNRPTF